MEFREFREMVSIDSDGCWEWLGPRNPSGYASVRGKTNIGHTSFGHRLSYYHYRGDLIKGLCIMHSCDNRSCVNPNHLTQGTQKENIHDMLRKKRQSTFHKDKTHCKHGHLFSKENTYADKRGSRHCKTCNRIASKKRREKCLNQ